ncbi:MAG: hypothetical protein WD069_19700 [Planctomycetales bacterium]
MIAWLRTTSPPGQYLAGAALAYLIVTAVPPLLLLWMGVQFLGGGILPLDRSGLAVLGLAAVAYAIFRVAAFHPGYRPEYRKWLAQTPWRSGMPLPLGPVRLVWQDALFVTILTAMSLLHDGARPLSIPTAFVTGWLVAAAAILAVTAEFRHAYVLALGLGGVPLLWDDPTKLVVLLAGLVVIGQHGLGVSLERLREWDLGILEHQTLLHLSQRGFQEAARNRLHGWPFDRLAPHRNPYALSTKSAAALAVLAGWWWFVWVHLMDAAGPVAPGAAGMTVRMATMLGTMAAASRLWGYVWGYAPPINLWGRLATFRWIIPRYDVVFVGPLLVVLLAVTTYHAAVQVQLHGEVVSPLLVAAQLFIILTCPPSLDRWRLTGKHRIVPATSTQAGELQQTL